MKLIKKGRKIIQTVSTLDDPNGEGLSGLGLGISDNPVILFTDGSAVEFEWEDLIDFAILYKDDYQARRQETVTVAWVAYNKLNEEYSGELVFDVQEKYIDYIDVDRVVKEEVKNASGLDWDFIKSYEWSQIEKGEGE